MIEEGKVKESLTDTCKLIHKTSQFLRLIQRLIINQKTYLKEAFTSELPKLCHKWINVLLDLHKKGVESLKDKNASLYKCIQNLLHCFLLTLFSLVHIQNCQMSGALMDFAKKNHLTPDVISKIKTKYTRGLPPQSIMILCSNLIEASLAGHLKNQILVTAFNLGFRIILDKNEVTVDFRANFIQNLFSKLNEVLASKDKAKVMDHNMINSIAILFFENDSLIQGQIEKFIQRVLYTRYEYQVGQEKSDKSKEPPQGHTQSKTIFFNFLEYFKRLSAKN